MSLEEILQANTAALEANTNALLNVPATAPKTTTKKAATKGKTKTAELETEPETEEDSDVPPQSEVDEIVTEVAELDDDNSRAIVLLADFKAEKSNGVAKVDREAFIAKGKEILAAGRKKSTASLL